MNQILLFAFFLIFSSQAFAGAAGACIVTGEIASSVRTKTFKGNMQRLIFKLKLISAVGAEGSEDKWCSDIFSKQIDKNGSIKIDMQNTSKAIAIPPKGQTASYLWTFIEFEHFSGGSFSPYVEPVHTTESVNPSGV